MKLLRSSRKLHKWLMLFLGSQFLIWSISGAYMVILNIDYIHGDSLVVNHQTKIDVNKMTYPLSALRQAYPSAENIEVGIFIAQEVYRFSLLDEKYLVNASNGDKLSPITANTARGAAKHYYRGTGDIISVDLITQDPPAELSRRALPAWRINFSDFASPAIYVSAQTGELVGKRHQYWRLFDLMFSLHVMDYEQQDASNKLLFWFALFSILASIFGAIISYFVIFKAAKSKTQVAGVSHVTP